MKDYSDKARSKPKPAQSLGSDIEFERELRDAWLYKYPNFLFDPKTKHWLYIDDFGHWYNADAYAVRTLNGIAKTFIDKIKDEKDQKKAKAQIQHAHIANRVLGWAQHWRNIGEAIDPFEIMEEPKPFGLLAMHMPPIAFDDNKHLLGIKSGVVDLRNGEIRQAAPDEFIRTYLDFDPVEGLSKPFNNVVEHIAGVDVANRNDGTSSGAFEVVYWLQNFLGYCLTAETKEEALLFMVGQRGTGKSTLGECLLSVFGEYGTNVEGQRFTASRQEVHTQWLARLKGRRLIVLSELKPRTTWDTTKLNRLVDGSSITANRMHHDDETFISTTKAIIYANHEPKFHAEDGIARRIKVLHVNKKPAVIDKDLKAALVEDRAIILHELIEFAQRWYKEGMPPAPPAIESATEQYKRDQDTVTAFMNERTEKMDGAEMGIKTLHTAYKEWCLDNDISLSMQLGRQHFRTQLEVNGYETYTRNDRTRMPVVLNVRLLDELNV